MELRQLQFFVTLAETLHFGRAAEHEFVTPSALSQQLKRLEREVGAPLMERSSRHVALTPAGEAFLVEAVATLAAAQRALTAAREAADGHGGRLVVGVFDEGLAELNTPIIKAFGLAHPRASLQMRMLDHDQLAPALSRGGSGRRHRWCPARAVHR